LFSAIDRRKKAEQAWQEGAPNLMPSAGELHTEHISSDIGGSVKILKVGNNNKE